MLHRARKEGLGPAYLAGFERALADGAELVLEMDCDFSHDPADVPRLIAAAENGADIAIGSRYVKGGQVGNWGLTAPARSPAAARSTPRSSCGSGSRTRRPASSASGARVLESIDPETITARGYAFQIETTFRAKRRGFRIVEVPITFDDRTHGASKMSRWIVLEAVWRVPLLRLRG